MTPIVTGIQTTPETRTEVFIIGGGPAGSTAAAFLADRGYDVVQVEKDRHPRFHIGESLLPMNMPILERLGVMDEVRRIGVFKPGAEFVSDHPGKEPQTYYFRDAWYEDPGHAYQVKREDFDKILFDNAARRGAETHEGIRVTDVTFLGRKGVRVHASDAHGREFAWHADWLLDASGRDTFLSKKLGWKKKNPRHNSAALFGHFRNVRRREGEDAGNISIYWFKHGWFWLIPISDEIMSVGVVAWPEYLRQRKGTPENFLKQTFELCPGVAERMRNAELVNEVRATGNFSYQSRHMTGDRFLLLGDAFAFVDPVFSSGVYLAMNSAELAAETVDECMRDPARTRRALKRYDRTVRRGLKQMSWFIYRFTSPAMHQMFMNPRNYFRVQEAVTSMLAGDVFGRAPIGKSLLAFRFFYRMTQLGHLVGQVRNWRRRRRQTAIEFRGGTTSQDEI